MSDFSELKRLAEAAAPGRNFDRYPEAGGGLKYECTGDDGSLVLKVDHKNDEWGFVGEKGEQDEAFFLACTPATVLGLVAEIEQAKADGTDAFGLAQARADQIEQLEAENEILRRGMKGDYDLDAWLDWAKEAEALRKHAPSAEIIWCACGDGYPANSYGAGFMDANGGVCENCDAANGGFELRKDAERYRWLLRNASVILDKKAAYQAETGFIKFDTMPGRRETESAIDAAMSKEAQS